MKILLLFEYLVIVTYTCVRGRSGSITITILYFNKSYLITLNHSLPMRTYSGLEHWYKNTFTLFTFDLTSISLFEVKTILISCRLSILHCCLRWPAWIPRRCLEMNCVLTCVKIWFLMLNNDSWLVSFFNYRVFFSVLFGKIDAFLASSRWV